MRKLIHRDQMLEATGFMPREIPLESPRSWEHRKAQAAQRAAKALGLTKYAVPGTRALRYDRAEVASKTNAVAIAA